MGLRFIQDKQGGGVQFAFFQENFQDGKQLRAGGKITHPELHAVLHIVVAVRGKLEGAGYNLLNLLPDLFQGFVKKHLLKGVRPAAESELCQELLTVGGDIAHIDKALKFLCVHPVKPRRLGVIQNIRVIDQIGPLEWGVKEHRPVLDDAVILQREVIIGGLLVGQVHQGSDARCFNRLNLTGKLQAQRLVDALSRVVGQMRVLL